MSALSLLPALAVHTLVHLLIVGAVIYLAALAALRLVGQGHPRKRYALAAAAFAAAALLPLALVAQRARKPASPAAEIPAAVAAADGGAENHGPRVPRWLALALPAVWVGGIAVQGFGGVVSGLGLWRLRRTWTPATDAHRRLLGWPDGVRLEVGPAGSPMAVGLTRTVVFMPAWAFDELEPEALRQIGRHELAHVRWKDPLVDRWIRTVRACLWPAAPLWLLERLVRREREAAADHGALEPACGPERRHVVLEYASTLVRVASRRRLVAAGLGATGELEHRVRRLLQPAGAPRRDAAAAAAFVLLAGCAAAAGLPLPGPGLRGPAADTAGWGPLDHYLGFNPAVEVVIAPGQRRVRIEGHELSPEGVERWLTSHSLAEKAEIVRQAARAGRDPTGAEGRPRQGRR